LIATSAGRRDLVHFQQGPWSQEPAEKLAETQREQTLRVVAPSRRRPADACRRFQPSFFKTVLESI
jgi:hypothetical protein